MWRALMWLNLYGHEAVWHKLKNRQKQAKNACFVFLGHEFSGVQVILFEIVCPIFYTYLHELFCQFINWTNWVNSGKFMDNCWISCQVMADMKKVYDDLTIINLYYLSKQFLIQRAHYIVYSKIQWLRNCSWFESEPHVCLKFRYFEKDTKF